MILKTPITLTVLVVLLTTVLLLNGCDSLIANANVHRDVKVRSANGWGSGRIKECWLLTGVNPIQGLPPEPDPLEMQCPDFSEKQWGAWAKSPRMKIPFEYLYTATVEVDAKSQATFDDRQHWFVPVSCTRVGERRFSCEYNGSK